MERYPEEWLCEPVADGPMATIAPYIEHNKNTKKDDGDGGGESIDCLLCNACQIRSNKTLKEHLEGKRHRQNYDIFKKQQRAWYLDQLIPAEFITKQNLINENQNNDPSTLSYIMPFRRWRKSEQSWRAGMTCQLCGTGDMSTRQDVVHHCFTSKRHSIIRSSTYMKYHPEIYLGLSNRIRQLPNKYQWEFNICIIKYVGSKEAAFAGLESQLWVWYHLLHKLELYEIRTKFIYLELGIWKLNVQQQRLLEQQDDEDGNDDNYNNNNLDNATAEIPNSSSSNSEEYYEDHHDDNQIIMNHNNRRRQQQREEIRATCGSTVILQNILPFLQTMPRLVNELGW